MCIIRELHLILLYNVPVAQTAEYTGALNDKNMFISQGIHEHDTNMVNTLEYCSFVNE